MTLRRRILLYYSITLSLSLVIVGFWSWFEFNEQRDEALHGGAEAALKHDPLEETLEIILYGGLPAILLGIIGGGLMGREAASALARAARAGVLAVLDAGGVGVAITAPLAPAAVEARDKRRIDGLDQNRVLVRDGEHAVGDADAADVQLLRRRRHTGRTEHMTRDDIKAENRRSGGDEEHVPAGRFDRRWIGHVYSPIRLSRTVPPGCWTGATHISRAGRAEMT